MARMNVNTPRFYISWGDYWKSLGADVHSLNLLNPSQQGTDFSTPIGDDYNFPTVTRMPYPAAAKGINFYAVLGHNMGTNIGAAPYFAIKQQVDDEWQEDILIDGTSHSMQINTGDGESPEHDGFSIGVITNPSDGYVSGNPYMATGIRKPVNVSEISALEINSFVFGQTYDMPHSPDLNLKLSYEYDGVKTIQTKGGATLSNASYTKPADWGDDIGAWQLGGEKNYRSGRRVWDLSFSFLADSDIMPKVAATTNYEAGDNYVDGFPQENTLLEGTDFFSQVWNRTMGGHLPFIFQSDKDDSSPQNFAICRFDQSSLQYNQISPNLYNVKLKIRETW
tara:strand:- start:1072 stop:2082 length:1011 start_codon:yes stop_codon:yes gene_type:complete